MPHYVPHFEFTEEALALREYNYQHWCEHGHGPNLRDVHEELGYDRRQIVQLYKELARKFHPDRNPGDDAALTRFKEISAAYRVHF